MSYMPALAELRGLHRHPLERCPRELEPRAVVLPRQRVHGRRVPGPGGHPRGEVDGVVHPAVVGEGLVVEVPDLS